MKKQILSALVAAALATGCTERGKSNAQPQVRAVAATPSASVAAPAPAPQAFAARDSGAIDLELRDDADEETGSVLMLAHDDPDDDVRVDVPDKAREMAVPAALNDSFGFGGHNVALLFRKA